MDGGAEADVAHDQARPRAAAEPAAASARCRDLDVWHRSIGAAGDLSLVRRDRDGGTRTEVRSALVKAGLWYLRAFMDGPSRPEPGANARPGLERMADDLGVSRRQALAILRAGVAHGYLVQTARGHTESTATYAAALPVERVRDDAPIDVERVRDDAPIDVERVRHDPKRVRHDAREGASRRTPPPPDLRKTKNKNTSDVPSDPEVSDKARDLTRTFAQAVKGNGHKIPEPDTKAHRSWLVEMDRLLRIDHADPAEVAQVIAWCAADVGSGSYPGESVNVRAVPKFRERYSELRLRADRAQRSNGATPATGEPDPPWDDAWGIPPPSRERTAR
jgi:hypothetical protein